MTRISKREQQKYKKNVGSRAEVFHGTAHHTTGGLTKQNLLYNPKTKRIISKKKHFTAKKENRLVKHGYGATKGHFGYVKINNTSKNNHKGGANSVVHISNKTPRL